VLPLEADLPTSGDHFVGTLFKVPVPTERDLFTKVLTVQQLLSVLDHQKFLSDWLFQHKDGSRKKMSNFNETIYDNLYDIQRRLPELVISEDTGVADDFHLACSFQRGATTRAQLANVPESVVEWVNIWGTGTEIFVKGPMRIIYSERKVMLEHYLRFSRAL
jgi:hypothetical protein